MIRSLNRIRRANRVLFQDDTVVVLELTQGKTCVLDAADYHLVKGMKWTAVKSRNHWYVHSSIWTGAQWRTVKMHRAILDVDPDQLVDHINLNGLDNRRSNLRICTNRENIRHSPRRSDNTSGYKGVHRRYNGRWQARIIIGGQRVSLGHFADPKDAAEAYDDAARKHYGSFALTNFP